MMCKVIGGECGGLLVYEILEVEQFLLTLFKRFGNAVLQWGGDLKFYKGISTCGNANGKHLGGIQFAGCDL